MSFFTVLSGIFEGFRVTLLVTALGLVFAIPFALVFGTAQYLATGRLRFLVTALIEFWRSSPVIVLLYVFYYSLPSFGVLLPATLVGAMVLGLNTGGYGSQSVRAALQTLDRGQREAGLALGMRRSQTLRYIELPQSIMVMIPVFINQVIQLIKGTSLVSLITLSDMTWRAKELSQIEYNPVGIYSGLMLAYLIVCYPIAILGRYFERRYVPSGMKTA